MKVRSLIGILLCFFLVQIGCAAAYANEAQPERPTPSDSIDWGQSAQDAEAGQPESSGGLVSSPSVEALEQQSGVSPLYGILAWVCIGLAVVLVVAVLLSNLTTGRSGRKSSGRSYAKNRNHPGRRHLLDDSYYIKKKKY